MKVDPEDVQRHFREMPDAELRDVLPSQLTLVGLHFYEEEKSARGWQLDPEPSLSDEQFFETTKALAEKIRRESDTQPSPRREGFQVAITDIAALYERITDDELLKLDPKDLTSDALECYTRETARRGLAVQLPQPPNPPNPDEAREVEELLTDARIWSERQQRRGTGAGRMQPGIAQAVLALVSLAIFLSQQKSASSGNRRSILWLRRFRSARQDGAFKSLLAEACCGLATVLTVQDSTVFYSSDRGLSRFSWLMNGLIGVTVIANFFPFEKAVFVYSTVFALMAVVFLIGFGFRGLGVTTISRERPAEHVAEVIQGIKKGANTGSHEPIVLKCDQQIWQTTVATAEALCDAIVIDVADLSIYMEWELACALRLTPHESIILVCGIENGASEEIPPETVARIEKVMGAGFMEKCPIFFFPLTVDRATDTTERSAVSKLQRLLAKAIVRKQRIVGG